MLTLAMESSAKPASVAICSDGALLGQYYQNNGLTHSRTLLAMLDSLLKNLDVAMSDIEQIAVASGPGSFTGVRIGVSAAKGLAWGLDIPICGVSTLEAIAYQNPGQDSIVCPVMDARRNQVYNALFQWREGSLIRIRNDRAIALDELADDLTTLNEPILLVGDGAEISYTHLIRTMSDIHMAHSLARYQSAYGVALAAANNEPISAIELEPRYLRPSQAEQKLGQSRTG